MTTSAPSIPRLTPFNFNEWHVACTVAAKQVLPTNGPLGGLGLLLPSDAYTELNGHAYVLATKPDEVTNTAQAHQQKIFDREQQALGTLTAAVYDTIPIPTQQSCAGYSPVYGSTFIPLPEMIAHVTTKFGTYTQHRHTIRHAPYSVGLMMVVILMLSWQPSSMLIRRVPGPATPSTTSSKSML